MCVYVCVCGERVGGGGRACVFAVMDASQSEASMWTPTYLTKGAYKLSFPLHFNEHLSLCVEILYML